LGRFDKIESTIRAYEEERASGGKTREITRYDIFDLLKRADVEVLGETEEVEK
jgi:hypothetical protein